MIKLRPKYLCLLDYLVQGHQLPLFVPAQVRIQQLDYVHVHLYVYLIEKQQNINLHLN